jgi:glycosyltransferase involved in cell wall biosynthesis
MGSKKNLTFSMPKLSIITINLNNAEGLQKTMESIFDQTFTDYEYIIIDGGSADGSVDEIKKHESKLSYWISEKDNGIYNAMNKGIAKAKGEYIMFMNSGDYLYSDKTLNEIFKNSNNEDIIYGDAMSVDGNGTLKRVIEYPGQLTFKHFLTKTIHHTSSLIKAELFQKYGLYNEENRIVSDWEFFIKVICLYQVSYKYLNFIFSCFIADGISSQVENREIKLEEKQKVLNKFFPAFLPDYKEDVDKNKLAMENAARLRLYKNSRLHKVVEILIHARSYQFVKKRLNKK